MSIYSTAWRAFALPSNLPAVAIFVAIYIGLEFITPLNGTYTVVLAVANAYFIAAIYRSSGLFATVPAALKTGLRLSLVVAIMVVAIFTAVIAYMSIVRGAGVVGMGLSGLLVGLGVLIALAAYPVAAIGTISLGFSEALKAGFGDFARTGFEWVLGPILFSAIAIALTVSALVYFDIDMASAVGKLAIGLASGIFGVFGAALAAAVQIRAYKRQTKGVTLAPWGAAAT